MGVKDEDLRFVGNSKGGFKINKRGFVKALSREVIYAESFGAHKVGYGNFGGSGIDQRLGCGDGGGSGLFYDCFSLFYKAYGRDGEAEHFLGYIFFLFVFVVYAPV